MKKNKVVITILFLTAFAFSASSQLIVNEKHKISEKIRKYFTSGCTYPESMGNRPTIQFLDDYDNNNTTTFEGIAEIECVEKRSDGSWLAGTGNYKEYYFIAIFRKRNGVNEYIKEISIKKNGTYIQIFPSN